MWIAAGKGDSISVALLLMLHNPLLILETPSFEPLISDPFLAPSLSLPTSRKLLVPQLLWVPLAYGHGPMPLAKIAGSLCNDVLGQCRGPIILGRKSHRGLYGRNRKRVSAVFLDSPVQRTYVSSKGSLPAHGTLQLLCSVAVPPLDILQ